MIQIKILILCLLVLAAFGCNNNSDDKKSAGVPLFESQQGKTTLTKAPWCTLVTDDHGNKYQYRLFLKDDKSANYNLFRWDQATSVRGTEVYNGSASWKLDGTNFDLIIQGTTYKYTLRLDEKKAQLHLTDRSGTFVHEYCN